MKKYNLIDAIKHTERINGVPVAWTPRRRPMDARPVWPLLVAPAAVCACAERVACARGQSAGSADSYSAIAPAAAAARGAAVDPRTCTPAARRLYERRKARAARAARIAAQHSSAPAVVVWESAHIRAVNQLNRPHPADMPIATGRTTQHIAACDIPVYKTAQGTYTTAAPAAGAAPVEVRHIDAHDVKGDCTPYYRRPSTPVQDAAPAAPSKKVHPGMPDTAAPAPILTAAPLSTKHAKTGCKASYSAQHTAAAPLETSPLWRLACGCAVHVVKCRIQDTMPHSDADAMRGDCGMSTFTALYYAAIADSKTIDAARAALPALCDAVEKAAADLASAQRAAALSAKAAGLTGAARKRYIADTTATQAIALAQAKKRVTAAEKVDAAIVSDFADVASAAYCAGLELCADYAAAADGTAPADSDDTINALLARAKSERPALDKARADVDAAKDAAKKAGYTRYMDFAPYRAAKDALAYYRGRSLIITMSAAARVYIGSRDHGGRCVAADITGAAMRHSATQSAENAALYGAINAAAQADPYNTLDMADMLQAVPHKMRPYVAAMAQDFKLEDIAKICGVSVSTAFRRAEKCRAYIAAMPGYSDTDIVRAYLASRAK